MIAAIDIIITILLLGCIGYGIYAGFIKIFFGFLSIILGSIIAGKFYIYGSQFMPQNNWTLLFSFALIFFFVSFVIMLLGKLISAAFEKMLLKPVDKSVGALFMLFLGVLLTGIFYSGTEELSPQTIAKIHGNDAKIVQAIYKFDKGFFNILPKSCQAKLKNMSAQKVENKIDDKVEKVKKIEKIDDKFDEN